MGKKVTIREKLMARRVSSHGPLAPADDDFRKDHPLLFELLTRPLVVNGKVLDMPRLSLSLGDGDWQLSVSDGVLCQSTSVRGLTFHESLRALETVLASGDAKWSTWKGKEPRLPKPKENGKPKKVDNDHDSD